jgi:glucosamine--fructose-6-phosphate aminotransferase (isomerizing)
LAICNVLESTLLREADFSLLTRAGREISVASTKAFTAQLSALLLFTLNMAKQRGKSDLVRQISRDLQALPGLIDSVLLEEQAIKQIAPLFKDKNSTLFLGRGSSFPLALEGALKLKEISYIHAEGYAAGELKHGPIALIDKNMPVIIIAPTDACLEKLKSNIEEVRSREGEIIVFTDKKSGIDRQEQMTVFYMPEINAVLSPILYSIPLQLLSYHVAILRGAEVDQPRNLAKSVTVE